MIFFFSVLGDRNNNKRQNSKASNLEQKRNELRKVTVHASRSKLGQTSESDRSEGCYKGTIFNLMLLTLQTIVINIGQNCFWAWGR